VTSDELYIYKPSRTWRGEVVNGAENFFGLLAFLMCPSPGGSPITEVLGRWFRQLGAQGLVFPSARNDAACLFEKGRLTGYEGWNFVDYRDAAAPALRHTMIQEPHSWGRNDIAVRYFKGSVRDGTWRTESISRQTIDTVEERLSTYQSKERRQMDIAKLAAQAQAAYDAGRFAEALKLATDLAKKRNNDYDVLLFLGNCHARLAQHREAVVAFHQASLVDRTASAPFSNSGNSLMALGDYGAAAASFQRALELDADDTAAQANLPIAEMLHNRSTSGGKVVHLSGKDLPED
jgi:tetratricopeptide (TPR) repeat protein